MKDLFIKKIEVDKQVDIEEAAHLLETKTVTNPIDILNWEDYSYRPDLKFRIGHTDNEIWLKYYVKEAHILAQETNINGAVHKDSCAEFFISLDGKNYYNLEINCIDSFTRKIHISI